MITNSRRHKLDKSDRARIIKKYIKIFKTAKVIREKPTSMQVGYEVGYDPLSRV